MTIDGMLDLFAGTGVGVAAQRLGIREYGVEIMPEAVASRDAAGFETPYNDAWDIGAPERLGLRFNALWASPPCQTFSVAGSGAGRLALDDVLSLIDSRAFERDLRAEASGFDDRTALVLIPLAYIHRYRPAYVALEQVPTVLPIWEAYADVMRGVGYSVWTGHLHSEQYGVPQTRKRAYLIARSDGIVAAPPPATGTTTLAAIRPDQQGMISGSSTLSPRRSISIPGSKLPRGYRRIDEPGFTATSKVTSQRWYPSMEMITEREAKLIQSYPQDFPFQGGKNAIRLQIGNAVPPLVAEAVLSTFA